MMGCSSSPLKWWIRVTSTAESAVSEQLAKVGKQCAIHPWKCIFTMLFLCFACGAGMALFEEENDGRKLWTDQNSEPMKNLEYVEDNFENSPRMSRMVFTASNGGNVLTMTTFDALFTASEEVLALGDTGKRYEDLCLTVASGACIGQGVLRYFNSSRAVYNQMVQTDADILMAVNSPVFPDDRSRAFARDNIGGIQRDEGGNIISATAVRIDYFLDGVAGEDDKLDWELELQDKYVDSDSGLINQPYADIKVFLMAERSQDDELARTVGGDVPLFALAFVIMSTFCSLLLGKTCSWTQSRKLLGFMDFLLVLQGALAGYGVAMLIGRPFTVLQQVLPFILVGIGLDDAFVITSAFDKTNPTLAPEERVEQAMGRVGVSITLTSITDMAAFLLGATCAFPSVKHFCIYAAFSCFFIWLLHCTSFVAMLAMDARRAANRGLDPCVCCTARASCMAPEGVTQGPEAGSKTPVARFLGAMTRALVCHPVIMLLTVGAFVAVAAVSAWQVSDGLGTDFKLIDLTPDESFVRDFYNEEERHWGGITSGLGVMPAYYVRDVDFGTVAVQRNLELVGSEMLALSKVNEEAGLKSWSTEFALWAWQNRGTDLLPLSAFEEIPGGVNRAGCEAGLPAGTTVCPSHFLTGSTFGPAVQLFLSLPQYGRFEDDVVFHADGSVMIARMHAKHVDTKNSDQQVDVLEQAEDFSDKWQGALPGSFMLAGPYIYYDQFRIIVQQMATSILLCLLAVTVITVFVLAHPFSVLITLAVLSMVFMDLMGNILVWGLDLNSISMINLVMAIGLVVDYSMHIAHSFGLQDPSLPRTERAVLTMEEIGPAVFMGVCTTFIAILPLSMSNSEIFRVFFRMFFGIVVIGGVHGLVLMPVALAICGPSSTDLQEGKQVKAVTPPVATKKVANVEISSDVETAS